ncbi:hypothetical protein LTR53_013345 [Teratosphaeriaceae sp. CCFEE 6253]|nr:hypothetical protein LTR53_013345 [Teratosphaeriaceae sp. CCFEE 6253]
MAQSDAGSLHVAHALGTHILRFVALWNFLRYNNQATRLRPDHSRSSAVMAYNMTTKRKSDNELGHASKRLRSDYSTTITILVGHDERPFIVHQDLICSASKFFEKACSGTWRKSRNEPITMKETDADVFRVYVEKLYSPSIDLNDLYTSLKVDQRHANGTDTYSKLPSARDLSRLWAFGDYVQDHTFQNVAIDALVDRPYPSSFSTAEWVAHNVSGDSPLVRLIVDTLAMRLKRRPHLVGRLKSRLPASFLVMLLKATLNSQRPVIPYLADKCKYHVHPDGTEKCVNAAPASR